MPTAKQLQEHKEKQAREKQAREKQAREKQEVEKQEVEKPEVEKQEVEKQEVEKQEPKPEDDKITEHLIVKKYKLVNSPQNGGINFVQSGLTVKEGEIFEAPETASDVVWYIENYKSFFEEVN